MKELNTYGLKKIIEKKQYEIIEKKLYKDNQSYLSSIELKKQNKKVKAEKISGRLLYLTAFTPKIKLNTYDFGDVKKINSPIRIKNNKYNILRSDRIIVQKVKPNTNKKIRKLEIKNIRNIKNFQTNYINIKLLRKEFGSLKIDKILGKENYVNELVGNKKKITNNKSFVWKKFNLADKLKVKNSIENLTLKYRIKKNKILKEKIGDKKQLVIKKKKYTPLWGRAVNTKL